MKVIFNNHIDSIQTEKNIIINVRIISYLVSSESYTFNYKVFKIRSDKLIIAEHCSHLLHILEWESRKCDIY